MIQRMSDEYATMGTSEFYILKYFFIGYSVCRTSLGASVSITNVDCHTLACTRTWLDLS